MWGAVFSIINLYQIARIYAQRRPVVLSPDEQMLYDLAFRSLRPREFLAFVMLGEWRTAQPGEVIFKQAEVTATICIATEGSVEIRRNGQVLGDIEPGYVIGLTPALTGQPSLIEARFRGPARFVRWSIVTIREFVDSRPELRAKLQSLVSRDLALKVEKLALRDSMADEP